MSGFADLVLDSDPAYYGGGHNSSRAAGTTWRWVFQDITDGAGDAIDFTSVTGVCKIVEVDRTTPILSLTFTPGVGMFTISATKAATAGLFTGADYSKGRVCYWYLTLDNGTDEVAFWMVDNSPFTIRKGA